MIRRNNRNFGNVLKLPGLYQCGQLQSGLVGIAQKIHVMDLCVKVRRQEVG